MLSSVLEECRIRGGKGKQENGVLEAKGREWSNMARCTRTLLMSKVV